ncbi:MAG TPA: hypothetical protein ENJ45_00310, partial [Phaeodactylibacter sp.]|nr:hypothetical protein [Phaeodactylibacter sp.]
MKNRIFHFSTTFFLLASFFGPAAAQTSTNTDSFHSSTEKKSIAIWPFTGNNNFNALSDLYNIVTDAVGKSERFLLIERQKIDAILKELDFQMGHETEYTDILVEQGKTLGANFYLFGHINSVTTKENISHDSKTGKTHISYTCNISLVLRIVDIETGLVKMTETIEVGNILSLLSSKSPELAFTKACKKIASKTKKYIKKAFPINLSIIRIEEEKKGKA